MEKKKFRIYRSPGIRKSHDYTLKWKWKESDYNLQV